eukprot:247589-Rhodomonas_salina.3
MMNRGRGRRGTPAHYCFYRPWRYGLSELLNWPGVHLNFPMRGTRVGMALASSTSTSSTESRMAKYNTNAVNCRQRGWSICVPGTRVPGWAWVGIPSAKSRTTQTMVFSEFGIPTGSLGTRVHVYPGYGYGRNSQVARSLLRNSQDPTRVPPGTWVPAMYPGTRGYPRVPRVPGYTAHSSTCVRARAHEPHMDLQRSLCFSPSYFTLKESSNAIRVLEVFWRNFG